MIRNTLVGSGVVPLMEFQINKCWVCCRSFRKHDELATHVRGHLATIGYDPLPKKYRCPCCIRSYDDSYRLAKHMEIHEAEKLLDCPYCRHSFSTKALLESHVKQHTSVTWYKCPECPREFLDEGELRSHGWDHPITIDFSTC